MLKKLLFSLPLFLGQYAIAGSATSGTIHTIHYFSSGTVLFYTTGSRSGLPTCASNQPARFAINTNSDGGKSQLSGLLTAYATGTPVIVHGTNDCSVYGDTESVSFLYTND